MRHSILIVRMNLLVLCVLTFIVVVEAGFIKDLINTVKEDVHGVKNSIHNVFSNDHDQNSSNTNKESHGILTSIVDSVGNVHNAIHDTVHKISPFKKDKNKESGDNEDRLDITPADNVDLKPDDTIYVKTTTESATINDVNSQNYSDLIDVRFINVSLDSTPIERERTKKENKLKAGNKNEVKLISDEKEKRNAEEFNEKSTWKDLNVYTNRNVQDTRDGLIFYDQNVPAVDNENKNGKEVIEDSVFFPGMSNKPKKINDDELTKVNASQSNVPEYNDNKVNTGSVNKNCASGLVKAADGSCKEPIVINMNKNKVNVVNITDRDNFVGGCPFGTGRALDGTCQDSID